MMLVKEISACCCRLVSANACSFLSGIKRAEWKPARTQWGNDRTTGGCWNGHTRQRNGRRKGTIWEYLGCERPHAFL